MKNKGEEEKILLEIQDMWMSGTSKRAINKHLSENYGFNQKTALAFQDRLVEAVRKSYNDLFQIMFESISIKLYGEIMHSSDHYQTQALINSLVRVHEIINAKTEKLKEKQESIAITILDTQP